MSHRPNAKRDIAACSARNNRGRDLLRWYERWASLRQCYAVVTVRSALAGNNPERLKEVASDLVALKVDLIVTHSVSARAAKEVTKPCQSSWRTLWSSCSRFDHQARAPRPATLLDPPRSTQSSQWSEWSCYKQCCLIPKRYGAIQRAESNTPHRLCACGDNQFRRRRSIARLRHVYTTMQRRCRMAVHAQAAYHCAWPASHLHASHKAGKRSVP